MNLNSIQEVNNILQSKIFVFENARSYVFDENIFAILDGDMRLLIRRSNIAWKNINSKLTYSIFQQDSNFVFRTVENEICPTENEFILSVIRSENDTYTLLLKSLRDGQEYLRLHSD
jgi:hypothetical protein